MKFKKDRPEDAGPAEQSDKKDFVEKRSQDYYSGSVGAVAGGSLSWGGTLSPGHIPNYTTVTGSGTSVTIPAPKPPIDFAAWMTRIEDKLDLLINAEAERIREQYDGNH